MSTPNTFIVYVNNAQAAARFYGDLFEMKPSFESPDFISFEVADGVQFAVWKRTSGGVDRAATRTGEVCLALPGGPEKIDAQYEMWKKKGVDISEPEDAGFGRNFVVTDPDGNLIRVAPVD